MNIIRSRGGFLFSLVSIIGLSTDIYGDRGHIVLFAVILVVVAFIVATFLRWVDVLSRFGRVRDAIERTANAATDAVAGRVDEPNLGGRSPDETLQLHARVMAKRMGYVRHVDMAALQEVAEEAGGEIVVTAPPGTFLDGAMPIAATTFELNDERRESIRAAYDVADNQSFDQDPEYGLSALAEIGIKALSPAVNDPVTAMRVIDRLVCVLVDWGKVSTEKAPRYDRIHVPTLEADGLLDVAFSQLALHGAADVRVGVRLQEACRSFVRLDNPAMATAARRQASRALAHAEAALVLVEDYRRSQSVTVSLPVE